jgi:hypothetical protein
VIADSSLSIAVASKESKAVGSVRTEVEVVYSFFTTHKTSTRKALYQIILVSVFCNLYLCFMELSYHYLIDSLVCVAWLLINSFNVIINAILIFLVIRWSNFDIFIILP